MAELDVLCALALISWEGKMTRPTVHEQNDEPFLKMKGMKHPCMGYIQ